jgi:hypothetical protein
VMTSLVMMSFAFTSSIPKNLAISTTFRYPHRPRTYKYCRKKGIQEAGRGQALSRSDYKHIFILLQSIATRAMVS